MTDAVPCIACGRTNGPAATRCMWCGAIIGTSDLTSVETSQAEVDYVRGIERLEYPTPVKLVVNEAGLEITETLPGSRRISIPASSLIDARVSNPEEPESDKGGRRPWWSRVVGSRKEQRRLDAESGE
ncbi:MAG TPA: hypothetical protein VG778_00920, partial [Blastocatellia bacterium]|nr:hypothetical protein [Blastocatellia bacterium]